LRNETQRLRVSLVCRISSLDPAYRFKINGLVFRQPLRLSYSYLHLFHCRNSGRQFIYQRKEVRQCWDDHKIHEASQCEICEKLELMPSFLIIENHKANIVRFDVSKSQMSVPGISSIHPILFEIVRILSINCVFYFLPLFGSSIFIHFSVSLCSLTDVIGISALLY